MTIIKTIEIKTNTSVFSEPEIKNSHSLDTLDSLNFLEKFRSLTPIELIGMLDFDNRDNERNFFVLIVHTEKREGLYGSPRIPWLHKFTSRGSLLGMTHEIFLKLILKYFICHPETIQKDKPLNPKDIIRTVKDTYRRYSKNFGEWQAPKNQEYSIEEKDKQKEKLPFIPKEVKQSVPKIIKEALSVATSEKEEDLILLASITVLSSCFRKITGLYNGSVYTPHLSTIFIAPPASGKGMINHCRSLIQPIHDMYVDQFKIEMKEYYEELDLYESGNKPEGMEKPEIPLQTIFLIPGDITVPKIISVVKNNGSFGIIIETEIDTLNDAMKKDHGNYSTFLRKAAHHEKISLARKTNDELIEIEKPSIAFLICGTQNQLFTLIPSAENGLFSRIAYYSFEIDQEWQSPFKGRINIQDHFLRLGREILNLYKRLINLTYDITFELTPNQIELFDNTFSKWRKEFQVLFGNASIATVHRLGIIEFRIAMVLSALRLAEKEELPQKIVCNDIDFNNALKIANVLKKHASDIFLKLPQKELEAKNMKGKNLRFYEALPQQFERKDAMAIANKVGINNNSVDYYLGRYLTNSLLNKGEDYNQYIKPFEKIENI